MSRPWTTREVTVLFKYVNLGCDFRLIASVLNRSTNSVRYKYESYGLGPHVVQVILCGYNKIYIIATKHERDLQHFSYKVRSDWLQTHRPVRILEHIHTNDVKHTMHRVTLHYMIQYGILNVRNHDRHRNKMRLSKKEIKFWCDCINATDNKCFVCGDANHGTMDHRVLMRWNQSAHIWKPFDGVVF